MLSTKSLHQKIQLEWVEGGVQESIFFIYNGILLSHKDNEITPCIAAWMDLEIIVSSEASQIATDRCHLILFKCELYKKKMTQMNLYPKQRLTDTEDKLMVTKGKGGGGG